MSFANEPYSGPGSAARLFKQSDEMWESLVRQTRQRYQRSAKINYGCAAFCLLAGLINIWVFWTHLGGCP